MSEVKWIKLATDVFDNRKIKQIEQMPDGDTLIVIWFKILCLAGNVNDSGLVYFSADVPYTEQMLATEFRRPLTTMQMALGIFEKFGMIKVVNDVMHVSNWEKYQNIDGLERIREQTRARVSKYREAKRLAECNVTVTLPVTECNGTDIDIEEDKDKEKESNKHFIPPTVDEVNEYCRQRNNKVNAQHFVDFYESKGWMIGKNKMKNWKAAIRTWESKDEKSVSKDSKTGTGKFDCIKYDV